MPSNHPVWAENRLLNFLNTARSPEAIYHHPLLRDDPDSGSDNGYVLGEKVAQHIIEHRQQLPFPRYKTVEQLMEVKGLGKDKLNDLLHSFSVPADDAFRQILYDEILQENWDLHPQTMDFPSTAAFENVVNNGENFRRVVAELYAETQFSTQPQARQQLEMRIHQAHQENFFDGHLGAFQFAFWWYQFDYDNWFSFEMMKDVCERYLSYHGASEQAMQFRLLHLNGQHSITEFQRKLIIPVIVNFMENKITVWEAQLND